MSALSAGEEFFLQPRTPYAVAVSWDQASSGAVDIDLQAVLISTSGTVIDAVYFNNLKAMKCVTHSGDETTGAKTGLDEMIWVHFQRMPENVQLIIFVVAAHTGHLKDAHNGRIHILERDQRNEVASFTMERSEEEVDVVAVMELHEKDTWKLIVIEEEAKDGQHFVDILEPTIGNIVRKLIPGAPRKLKVAFAMDKGAVFDLPTSSRAGTGTITAGLGWDCTGSGIDLDVSAVLFDDAGQHLDTVFFGNLSSNGIEHSGDNLTGEGGGDDETIRVDLPNLPANAAQLFFTVNIYTRGKSFSEVANPYCRILDESSNEMARYMLREGGSQTGLVIARLFRTHNADRWGFQAVGSFCRGQTWKDSMPELQQLFRKTPRELQLRGGSQASLLSGGTGGGAGADVGAPVAAPPPQPSSACCSLQ
eukprot:TRINITY_DN2210_c0_g1_i1.p1 TRINITY_DN2210_c0_g1~~TRINITY_DN2210_c0_g1_i1.p1  ORF type:complete len:432 (+),score=83.81 TRINITY_DN2210_c0_g1_i1:35-1297(+)